MASKDTNSRMHKTKTDSFIQDYLSDIWGNAFVQNKVVTNTDKPIDEIHDNNVIETVSSALLLKRSDCIRRHFSLIPTIKIATNLEEQFIRTQVESTLILMTNLYFLRRPLSPKVRQYILILSEQVIDDFNAAYWLESNTLKEVYHEV